MENKAKFELEFWVNLSKSIDLNTLRSIEDTWKIDNFPELRDRKGKGLDLGSGPLSVFEGSKNNIIAVDPLMDEYNKICEKSSNIKYLKADGENLPFKDKEFDYVYCCNVIDHTPNPEKMVNEMKRLAKDKIYFQVNFDYDLSPCHYGLWNEQIVDKHFGDLKQIFKKIIEGKEQKLFWAIYEV